MIQSTNLNCDIIIFVWYLWFCQEHLVKLTHIMMDMLRGQRCWLMASEVTELVSTGETWINFNASCSGFIFTTSLLPTSQCTAVLAGSLAWSDCWEGRQLRAKHQDNVKYLCQALLRLDIRVVFFWETPSTCKWKCQYFRRLRNTGDERIVESEENIS